ncbi:MAG: TIGR04076 family protein [Dehalococcoidales bacterium]|nr:TIGR04076 family protein [Dehalococcoidales bacterium]
MFKVRCKLIEFVADVEEYPCHFHYKIGDEFHYDGVSFTGRICPGLFASMMPVIHGVFLLGNKYSENVMYLYRGHDALDPAMARYDGVGFRPLPLENDAGKPDEALRTKARTGKARGGHFLCGDHRTLAHFACEPVDLSDSDYAQPFYRREIAILEKVEKEAGIKIDEILDRFTDFERDKISPPLNSVLLEVLMDALTDMGYIDIRDGRAYATGKEPPSRPEIG